MKTKQAVAAGSRQQASKTTCMQPDFSKYNLIPAIVQDTDTNVVLMLGYMNEEAFEKTKKENRVTFFSRSKNRLWTKGETSGNFLNVKKICEDEISRFCRKAISALEKISAQQEKKSLFAHFIKTILAREN